MREELIKFIENNSFPCIMAKAVARTGYMKVHIQDDLEDEQDVATFLQEMYPFIDEFRSNSKRLASFALLLRNNKLRDFKVFEKSFWSFLKRLNTHEKRFYPHDSRVASDPNHDNFSFSIKSEAFFILTLHPDSPRWARRFKYPAIIFNPHIQFENLRAKGMFKKVRDLIRHRDKLLQGSINPMLSDFGERSEVFQYMGKSYARHESVPLIN